MKTNVLSISSPSALPQAHAVLQSGGVVAIPTDTVYGLAVPVHSATGIDKLFEIKGRDNNKAIAVLIGSLEQLPILTPHFSENAQKLAAAFWPGALTLIVASNPKLPANISPFPTIGIRMPNYNKALELLKLCGPLATTSANISGGNNTTSAQEVLEQLDGKIDLLLDGGPTPGAVASTVVDCTQASIAILRQGAISAEALHKIVA
jgi:L-threonylcarbamoyladenylate synthase